jgi:hypothetical protein
LRSTADYPFEAVKGCLGKSAQDLVCNCNQCRRTPGIDPDAAIWEVTEKPTFQEPVMDAVPEPVAGGIHSPQASTKPAREIQPSEAHSTALSV